MVTVRKILLATLIGAGLAGCGGSNSSGGSSRANPMDTLSSDVINHMTSALPSASRRIVSTQFVAPTWDGSPVTGLGCGGSNVTVKDYTLYILNTDYTCGDSSPTIFGRFGQTMYVFKVIASQVTFTNGAPTVGTHTVTAQVDMGSGPQNVSFPVDVTAVSGNSNFDVKITVANLSWTAYFKNRDNVVNLIATQTEDSDTTNIDILFWNKTTGAMTYTYANSKTDSDKGELQKIVIQSDGAARIGHFIINANKPVQLLADFPQGPNTTKAGLSFQFDTNSADQADFCITVATMADGATGCDPSLDVAGWIGGGVSLITAHTPSTLITDVFGGTGAESDILDTVPDFTLGGFNTLH